MRKYLTLIRLGFIESITFRANLVYWIIIDFLSVGIMPLLWIAVVRAGGQPIAGFDLAEIITYFIGIALIWQGVVTYPFWNVIRDVKDGALTNDLTRPYSYFGKLMFYNIGSRGMRLLCVIPFLVPILVVLREYVLVPHSITQLGMLAIALVVAFFMIFILHFIVGIVAFWFDEGFAVANMFLYIFGLFSGDFAPIALLPEWLQRVANILPFQYVLNFPLQIYLGTIDSFLFLTHMTRALLWCVVLYGVYHYLWRRGLRSFTGVGR